MMQPIANARLRPRICPSLPPVIISEAITSVYKVIAVWIPVTVVPTSLATVAIDTFITELSSVIRNWPAARVSSTIPAPCAARSLVPVTWRRYAGCLVRESFEPDDRGGRGGERQRHH